MLQTLWASEPVAVVAFCGVLADAVLGLLVAFGLPITVNEKLALQAFASIVVVGVSALIARANVYPAAKVVSVLAEVPAVPVAPVVVTQPV